MSESRRLHQSVLVLATLLGLYFGLHQLWFWADKGLVHGARNLGEFWPMLLLAGLGGALVMGLVSRGGLLERLGALALGCLGWALCTTSLISLPDFASASDLGGGPVLRWLFVGLGLGSIWFSCGCPWPGAGGQRIGHLVQASVGERALLLFVFFGTANGKLFAREAGSGFALLGLVGLVTIVLMVAERGGQGGVLNGARLRIGNGVFWCLASLPVWWFAAALASGRDSAMMSAWRLGIASLVALVALGCVGERSSWLARRLFSALMLGLLVVLLGGTLGVLEAAQYESLGRVLGSRLRVLGLHPNLGAALFAAALPMALGWVVGRPRGTDESSLGRRRLIGGVVFVGALVVLQLSDSRASVLGAAVGLIGFGLLQWTSLAKRLGHRTWLAIGGLGLIALVLLVSPMGAELRGTLDGKSMTQSALGQRWHIWRMSAAALVDNPVFGLGPGGFSGHARYALESYYDGTSQTLHTHNIFMAAAEGAGWLGGILFTLFVGGFFECLRRGIVSASPRDRGMLVGLFAGSLSLLACNQLDLGQSQLTLVPLLFLAAVVIAGLQREPATQSSPSGKAWCLPVACLGIVWLGAGSILIGITRLDGARKMVFLHEDQSAREVLDGLDSPLFLVDERYLVQRQSIVEERLGDEESVTAFWREAAERFPHLFTISYGYAEQLAITGQFDQAALVLEAVKAIDPWGEHMADTAMLQAWVSFGLKRPQRGIESLVVGLSGEAEIPGPLSKSLDAVLQNVNVKLQLDRIGDSIVAQAAHDEVQARRRIGGLVRAFEQFGERTDALPHLRGVIEASENPFRALYYGEIVLLRKLGREAEALAVWEASPFHDEINFQEVFAGLKPADGEPISGGRGEQLDVFFTAERLDQRYLGLALGNLKDNKPGAAMHELRRALYNAKIHRVRTELVLNFIEAARDSLRIHEELRMWAFMTFMQRASSEVDSAKSKKLMRAVMQVMAPSFGGRQKMNTAVADSLDGFGLGGRTMGQLLRSKK